MSTLFYPNKQKITLEHGSILQPVKENVQDVIQRWLQETGLKPVEVEQRAKKRGHRISSYYVEDMAAGKLTALNPTPRIIKAAAVGFGKPDYELVAAAMGWFPKETDQMNGLIREIAEAYKQLPPAKQKEKRQLLEMVNRELQREL